MTALGTVSVAALARWVEGRLDLSVGFVLPVPLVYSVDVVDPDLLDDAEAPAARLVPFVAGTDHGHDGVVVVMNEWLCPPSSHRRPGQHVPRRRARQVQVSVDGQQATVVRWEHDPSFALISLG
jgi:hypothetical protein